MPGYFFVSTDNGLEIIVNSITYKVKVMAAINENPTLARLKIVAYKQTTATYSLVSDDHSSLADDYSGSDAGFHWATTSQDVNVIIKAWAYPNEGDEGVPCLMLINVMGDQVEGVVGDELRFEDLA